MVKLILKLTLVSCLFIFSKAKFSGSDYGKWFEGEGTYYGPTSGGNCGMGAKSTLPKMYHSMLPVAINHDQYDGSSSCGSCLEVIGKGTGIGMKPIVGKFFAYVHDQCPECKRGDLDLSKIGDGRWNIKWRFIPCPKNDLQLKFEGSNDYYKKIQVRGLKYPARSMKIDGKAGIRANDNFFVSHEGKFPQKGLITVVDVKNNIFSGTVNMKISSGVLKNPKLFLSNEN